MTIGQKIRQAVHAVLASVDTLIGVKKPMVTVLCYHSIASDDWYFSNSQQNFAKHIEILSETHDFISLDDLANYVQGKKKITKPSIVITFDDGYKNVLSLVPLLKQYSITPTMFVLAVPERANRKEMDNNLPLMNWTEIKILQENGWTIGSHTQTHPNLITLSQKEQQIEIITSKKIIEDRLGISCNHFAFPRGKYNEISLEIIKKAGYQVAVTMDEVIITVGINMLTVPRIGINRSHTATEIKNLTSPLSILFRHWVGKLLNNMS